MRFLLAFLFIALAAVNCAIPAHKILNLPGWNQPLPSDHYSGMIEIDSSIGKNLHYWFVASERDPANDPVILWMNGGPGCSSMDGLFYEHGPFHFAEQRVEDLAEGEVPALVVNEHRWNKIANIIFLEAPAGVGFSFSYNDPTKYATNDTQTAQDNYALLLKFFAAYPEYVKNPFYVTGESYAGIYVPTLVDQISKGNDAGAQIQINLQGFAVGNGCIGNSVGSCSQQQGTEILMRFLYGHGLFSHHTERKYRQVCKDVANPDAKCQEVLDEISNEVGHVNIYDIYRPCISGNGDSSRQTIYRTHNPFSGVSNPINLQGPDECIDAILAGRYFNNDEVRKAIHVRSLAQMGDWYICNALPYTSNIASLLPLYPSLISRYNVLIYSGDVDASVPYLGTEEWVHSLNYPIFSSWKPWYVEKQVAGYVTAFDAANTFQFVTIKGAGHMVPQFKPRQAFHMIEKFLNNMPL